ncbi:MAG TPA: hypothetical protein PLP05_12225 [Sedimentisphaerales bacterium]|nr:hypothetical protein [Sedimentisphaerales bacterium]
MAKKPVKKASSSKKQQKVKEQKFESFKLCHESNKFVTFKITKQTLYWITLLAYIMLIDILVINPQIIAASQLQ